jgi:predicted PurR-regulated permease PerM
MRSRLGQSVLEYTIIVGIVTVVLYYMGTSVKRGMQSLVKVTADQVGNQQNADQDFNDIQQGYMQSSNSTVQESKSKKVTELGNSTAYAGNTSYNESSYSTSKTITNAGFTQTN